MMRLTLGRIFCFGMLLSFPLLAAPPQEVPWLQTSDSGSCLLSKAQEPLDLGKEIVTPVPVIIWPDCAVSCGNPYCVGGKDMDPCYTMEGPGFCTPTNNTCGEIHRSRCECISSGS
jgi:hypothetical protein